MRACSIGTFVAAAIPTACIAAAAPAQAERVDGTARWDLAESQSRVTTNTSQVRISITYGACTKPPGTPRVKRTARSVIITVPLPGHPLPPDVACIEVAYTKTVLVRLGARLGRRALRDGSSRPARFVTRARR